MNHLYFGDCLEVLKELSKNNESFIDLIYIDPPFNSKRNYNVLFESIDMKDANAQKQAFADTWSNVMYIIELNNLADLNKDLFDLLSFFDKSKCVSDSAVAYLTTMSIRIYYMHKLLNDTGSFYLHCDPTMSHYLKLICDMIFGEKNFRSDISWERSSSRSSITKNYRAAHDSILFYSKSSKYYYSIQYKDLSEESLKLYNNEDEKGKYQLVPLMVSGKRNGETGTPWKGVDPNRQGKGGMHWVTKPSNIEKYEKKGLVYWPKDGGTPRLKYYLEQSPGVPLNDMWHDIKLISASAKESLGYPTQKPEALLERILQASSKEGDIVADFFCGSGTTIAAAQKLKRKWLGADISHLAIKLILKRLTDRYGVAVKDEVRLHGFPKDVDSAKMLARDTENGRFGFQEWVIEVLLHGVVNPKKTADGGYDGYLTYQLDDRTKEFVLIETKSGGVNVKNMREFIQVVDKQKAAAGIFVCFEETVTREMLKEAKAAGTISLGKTKTNIDKIQILTVDDMLNEGKQPHLPNIVSTFRQAERAIQKNQLAISF